MFFLLKSPLQNKRREDRKMKGTRAICLIGLVLFLVGGVAANSSAREKSLLVTAGGVGGSWFIAGAAFNEVWEKTIPDLKTTIVPGGGNSNPIRVNKGEADVGFTYLTLALAGISGKSPYKEAMPNVLGLANLQINQYLMLAVLRSTGLNSYQDIKDKKFALKICPGTRGLGGELTFRLVLDEYGFSYKDIMSWGGKIYFASWNESVSQIQDGHANALTTQTPLQNPFLVELCNSRDMKFLPLNEKVAKAMEQKYGYSTENLPAGSYKGMDGEYLTIADSVVLIAKKGLSDEMAYQLVKVLCENQKRWVETHVMFKDFQPKDTAKFPPGVPIHPGALKYYKEKGYLK
jgi:TRAP transporter TAXI family solute receptor